MNQAQASSIGKDRTCFYINITITVSFTTSSKIQTTVLSVVVLLLIPET